MAERYMNLVHKRISLAKKGQNQTLIVKMKSGWAVLGDNQIIPGYCLLLADPVVDNLNILDKKARKQFLLDMTIIGDALLSILNVERINYSILGNIDTGLHAHIHPRYGWEKEEFKKSPPWKYNFMDEPIVEFNYQRDKGLIKKIREEIERLYSKEESVN